MRSGRRNLLARFAQFLAVTLDRAASELDIPSRSRACRRHHSSARANHLCHVRCLLLEATIADYLPIKGEASARKKGTDNSIATATTMVAVVRRAKLRNNIVASMFR